MSEQRLVDIHRILLDNSTLPVFYNTINNTLTYEGVDISEPLKVVHNFWRDRMAIACGVKKREDAKRVSYNFVHDKKPKVYLSGPITGREERSIRLISTTLNCISRVLVMTLSTLLLKL
jgi:hypothetical protein